MTSKLYNLAGMSTATTGTGTITLGSALSGLVSFDDAGVPDGAQVSYVIGDGGEQAVYRGTYSSSAKTLTRDTLLLSTTGADLDLSGTAEVRIAALAEDFNERLLLSDMASEAEAEAGTNNTKWMSPLRAAQLVAALATLDTGTEGSFSFAVPGGSTFIVKWGNSVSDGSGAQSHGFPTAFPHACLTVVVTPTYADRFAGVTGVAAGGFNYVVHTSSGGASGTGVNYIAIGY